MKAGLFLALFGAFWTAIVGTFDVFIGHALVRQSLARQYPTVVGRVTRSEVTRHSGSKGSSTYGARIEYTYRVGSQEYAGKRVRYGEFNSSDSRWAHATVAAHPVGKEIPVYYTPEDPGDALLMPGVEGSDLMLLLFLTPFNAIMLGVWSAGASALWHRWRNQPALAARVRITRGQRRICLVEHSPITTGAMALGLGAFLGVFVVGFGLGGFHPRLPVIQAVWAVILGIGVTAAFWQWLRIRSGRYDLVVDTGAGWIELPRANDQGPRRRIPLDAVQRLDVEAVRERTSKGGFTIRYWPVVYVQPGHGERIRLKQFHTESQAQAFADWLGHTLRLRSNSGGREV